MRLFLALNASTLTLSEAILKKLFTNLSVKKIEFRCVPDEQLHIPLVEIGDVGRGTFLGLHHMLQDLIKKYPPLNLKISGL